MTGAGATAFVVCDGGVEATLESLPVTSPFTWDSTVTGTFGMNRFTVNVDDRSRFPTLPPPVPPKLALDDESNYRN